MGEEGGLCFTAPEGEQGWRGSGGGGGGGGRWALTLDATFYTVLVGHARRALTLDAIIYKVLAGRVHWTLTLDAIIYKVLAVRYTLDADIGRYIGRYYLQGFGTRPCLRKRIFLSLNSFSMRNFRNPANNSVQCQRPMCVAPPEPCK